MKCEYAFLFFKAKTHNLKAKEKIDLHILGNHALEWRESQWPSQHLQFL